MKVKRIDVALSLYNIIYVGIKRIAGINVDIHTYILILLYVYVWFREKEMCIFSICKSSLLHTIYMTLLWNLFGNENGHDVQPKDAIIKWFWYIIAIQNRSDLCE